MVLWVGFDPLGFDLSPNGKSNGKEAGQRNENWDLVGGDRDRVRGFRFRGRTVDAKKSYMTLNPKP